MRSDQMVSVDLMECACEFLGIGVKLLERARPDTHSALAVAMSQSGASAHLSIDIHPNPKITAFIRIDGQSYELVSMPMQVVPPGNAAIFDDRSSENGGL